MNLKTVKRILKKFVQLRVKEPLVLVGHKGLGKTQTILDIGMELNMPVTILRLGTKEDVGDLLGNPYVTKERTTNYAPPSWFRSIQKGGILLLDEINRSKPALQDAIMQLLDSRRFDQYVLPDNVSVIGLMNPVTIEYNVSEFDKALIDRCIFLAATSDYEETSCYMQNHKFHWLATRIGAAIKERIDYGNEVDLPQKTLTPRGLRQISSMGEIITSELALGNIDTAIEIIFGCGGPNAVHGFDNLHILTKIPDAKEYFLEPEKYPLKNLDNLELQIFVDRITTYLKGEKPTQDLIETFTNLINKLPEEMVIYLCRILVEDVWLQKYINPQHKDFIEKFNKLTKFMREKI